MLRTINPQLTLWESILPQCCLGLPGDLAEIDELLDDERFFEPFRPFFDPIIGRPSIPMETYLRMMFLKYRYRLGYEPLCREVADSLAWRRFCRIPLGSSVPHPTTLMKITSLRRAGDRGPERGAAGQGPRRQADPPRQGARRHHGDGVFIVRLLTRVERLWP